ncbi:type II secretion system F family protein [Streptacidiphilus neutrinimicus]|uniref:type II secretion system F family protein n=1 Tax=Streptacidiphilus neutrinimicus TaxID=105420 RepID=UPI0005A983A0|nr:type II secretion system F family protein [Streptacidiphilus neutrinimicus]
MITWLVLTGGLIGIGAALLAAELRPAPPQLEMALDRLHPEPVLPGEAATGAAAPGGFYEALGARLRDLPGVTIPRRELALVGRTPERHLAQKLLSALIGLVAFPYVAFTASLMHVSLSVLVPAFCSLALAAVMWFLPDLLLRGQAAEARVDYLHATAAYLELVALERAADRGPAEALLSAARIGDGPVLRRIAAALDRAGLERRPPWDGLSDLAEELGLMPLQDLADTMRLAGTDGAAVYKTLRARAANLRSELLSDELARANVVSERMVLPGTMLVMIFTLLIGFPAVSRMMQ